MKTWCIIGASQSIGSEFVRQLLARGQYVIAVVRDPYKAMELWSLAASQTTPGALQLCECDITSESSIKEFTNRLITLLNRNVDYLVLSAAVLKFPARATEVSFSDFDYHLRTNAIGPIITAQKLIKANLTIGTIAFLSSDLGSATAADNLVDGFGAYAASKMALNQMLRHMAAELKRKDAPITVLALYPGEFRSGEKIIQSDLESELLTKRRMRVASMIDVIQQRTIKDSGTFWTWEGKQHPW